MKNRLKKKRKSCKRRFKRSKSNLLTNKRNKNKPTKRNSVKFKSANKPKKKRLKSKKKNV